MTTENLFAKENELLKKEIELLKREIDLMKREANLKQNTPSPTIDAITEIKQPIVGKPDVPMNCIEKKSCETKDKSDNDQIFKKANHLCYSNYNECYSGKQHNPQDLNYRRCSDGSKVLTRFPTVDVPNTTTDTKPEDTTNGGQDIKPNEGKTCCKEYSNDTIDKLRYLERGLYDIIYNKPMDDRLPFVINEYGSLVSKPDTCKNTCA